MSILRRTLGLQFHLRTSYSNFGNFGVLLGVIPGLVTAWLDRRLAMVVEFTPRTVAFVYAALFSNGFSNEPSQQIEWLSASLLIGLVLQYCCETRNPKSPLRRRLQNVGRYPIPESSTYS